MEFFQPVVDALNSGVDGIFAQLHILGMAGAAFVAVRGRKILLQYLPGLVQTFMADRIEAYILGVAEKAVLSAEEKGNRAAKAGVKRVEGQVNRIKFDAAKAYLQRRLPNWLVSDERVAELIDAGLQRAGLGLADVVKKYSNLAVDKLEDVKLPQP